MGQRRYDVELGQVGFGRQAGFEWAKGGCRSSNLGEYRPGKTKRIYKAITPNICARVVKLRGASHRHLDFADTAEEIIERIGNGE